MMKNDQVIYVEKLIDEEHGVWATVTLANTEERKWNAEIWRLDNYTNAEIGHHEYFPVVEYTQAEAETICNMLLKKFKGEPESPWPIFEKEEVVEKPKRYVRDGKIAVVYSPGYGAGLGSWNERHMPDIVTDPEIVEFILLHNPINQSIHSMTVDDKENEDMTRLRAFITSKYKDAYLGADILRIEWVSLGERWRIDEYDGSESIEILDVDDYYVA
jgi:hypothetical protein